MIQVSNSFLHHVVTGSINNGHAQKNTFKLKAKQSPLEQSCLNLNRELETCNRLLANFPSVALLARSLKGGQEDQGKGPRGATLAIIYGGMTPIQLINGAQ